MDKAYLEILGSRVGIVGFSAKVGNNNNEEGQQT